MVEIKEEVTKKYVIDNKKFDTKEEAEAHLAFISKPVVFGSHKEVAEYTYNNNPRAAEVYKLAKEGDIRNLAKYVEELTMIVKDVVKDDRHGLNFYHMFNYFFNDLKMYSIKKEFNKIKGVEFSDGKIEAISENLVSEWVPDIESANQEVYNIMKFINVLK